MSTTDRPSSSTTRGVTAPDQIDLRDPQVADRVGPAELAGPERAGPGMAGPELAGPGRDARLPTAADRLRPLLTAILGDPLPLRIRTWDGGATGPVDAPATLVVRSRDALRRIVWAPGELGLARAHVAGELDVEGDVIRAIEVLRDADPQLGWRTAPEALRAAVALGVLGPPPAPPEEEHVPRGVRHSLERDRAAVRHHYDVGEAFYRLVLGSSLTYSCAYFARPDLTLAEAQTAKHELVCRKLGLHDQPGQRLLDVGCGWGTMALHAAGRHGARVTAITLSERQAAVARRRAIEADLADRIEVRVQDYRELRGETFDAIASIGMAEHVGHARMGDYFRILAGVLRPTGRLLNHAISSVGGSRMGARSFVGRYVFPDGELLDVGDTVLAAEAAGLEVRDVESLREHYARTLRAWVENLERGWGRAVVLAGEGRARTWRLYMAGSAVGFADGGNGLHQVLLVRPGPDGASGMPPTRAAWTP